MSELQGQRCVNRVSLHAAVESDVQPPDNADEPFVLLNDMAQVIGRHFDVTLPVPVGCRSDVGPEIRVKNGKEFSVGLLENPVDHDWYGPLQAAHLSARDRLTVAGSLFLWRKTLPSSAPSAEAHRARISAPELAPPEGYIRHVCAQTEKLFPVGWDKGYLSQVERAVPTIKSCSERGRGKGGYRSTGPDRFQYGARAMGIEETMSGVESYRVKYMEAQCDGKTRAVSVMSGDAQVLKPLHKLLYDQISKYPWLLRGKAKPSRFRGFEKKPGQVFVSGDYESATDHLPVSTAEWILRSAFKNCRHVPIEVQRVALHYLRVDVEYPDGTVVKATRQLMGSLLCFPLLCIQNYLAFRWCFPDTKVPVRINGDDIVFRSTREEYDNWAEFVGKVGLRLSRGKTLVNSRFFSLNSTFFYTTDESVRLVPVIRCTALLSRKSPYPSALAGTLRGFLEGFRDEFRDELGAWFLSKRKKLIRKSGRSVVRGLGMPVTEVMLGKAGMWNREAWYFNSVPTVYSGGIGGIRTEGVPLPQAPDRLTGQVNLPVGWRRCVESRDPRVRRLQREEEATFWEEVVENAWGREYRPKAVEKEYWEELQRGSFESSYWTWSHRLMPECPARAWELKLPLKKGLYSFLGLRKRIRSKLPTKQVYLAIRRPKIDKGKPVWCRVDEGDSEFDEVLAAGTTWKEHFKEKVHKKVRIQTTIHREGQAKTYLEASGWLEFEEAADRVYA